MHNKLKVTQIVSEEFFTQLNDSDSEVNELIDRYVFLFILENLEPPVRYRFLAALDEDIESSKAVELARSHIDDFDGALHVYLQEKIEVIVGGTVTKITNG